MRIAISEGETLVIDVDGGEQEVFVVRYCNGALSVTASLPDDFNRMGELYRESYGKVATESSDDSVEDDEEEVMEPRLPHNKYRLYYTFKEDHEKEQNDIFIYDKSVMAPTLKEAIERLMAHNKDVPIVMEPDECLMLPFGKLDWESNYIEIPEAEVLAAVQEIEQEPTTP